MYKIRRLLISAVLGLTAAGGWSPPLLAAENAADTGSPAEHAVELARGAKAWSDSCGSCHNHREPQELTDRQWRVVVAHMRVRADLTGQQARDVLAFLQSSN